MPDEMPRTPTDASQPDTPAADVPTRRRFLGRVLGAAAVAVAVLSGVATAHFPIHLDVDIQPENAENFIDLDEHDTVAVAVHPTEFRNADGELETFDPLDRDRRYRFGSRFALEDGGGARPTDDGEATGSNSGENEGDDALLLEFPVGETGLDGGEETAWLFWEQDESGEHGLAGVDSVRVYADEPSNRDLLEALRGLLESAAESG